MTSTVRTRKGGSTADVAVRRYTNQHDTQELIDAMIKVIPGETHLYLTIKPEYDAEMRREQMDEML